MALKNLVFGFEDVVEMQRRPLRKLLEYLDHHRLCGRDAPVQGLAAVGRVEAAAVRERGTDALQNGIGIERPRYRIGRTQGPGLHRPMMKGVGENEQPRHRAVGFGAQFAANQLHALWRPQIDIDHNPGEMTGRSVGNIRRRDGVDLANGLQDAGQLAALIAAVRCQQQAASG